MYYDRIGLKLSDEKQNKKKMKKGSGKHKDMKQFMKAKSQRKIWLFHNIDDSADRIGNTSQYQQYDRTDWHCENGVKIQNDGPSHQYIKKCGKPSRGVKPTHFN